MERSISLEDLVVQSPGATFGLEVEPVEPVAWLRTLRPELQRGGGCGVRCDVASDQHQL